MQRVITSAVALMATPSVSVIAIVVVILIVQKYPSFLCKVGVLPFTPLALGARP
jgi:hypothetical protein